MLKAQANANETRCTDTWEEYTVTLFRGVEQEGQFKLYRTRERHYQDGPTQWSRWHLVTFGRTFETPKDACDFLEREWDADHSEQTAAIEAAQRTYEAGYAYACGYRD